MTTHEMVKPGRRYRRAMKRLEMRIHGSGEGHRPTGCGCSVWDRPGFRRPGSMKGQA